MSELLKYRQQQNLTQDELAEKSGISVRTIQRIEAGMEPKGYTLKALAKALNIDTTILLAPQKKESIDYAATKLINLLTLPFVVLPPANIIVPLVIMYRRKVVNELTKKLITLQILWSVIAAILFVLSAFLNRIFSADFPFVVLMAALLIAADIYMIIRNATAIDKKGELGINLKFSFL